MVLRGPYCPELLRNECLGDLLRSTAKRRPQHPAILWESQSLSYAQLDARSEAVAAKLIALGAKRGTVVGLHLPRGPELLIAQAAIAKSGAAWLPLDASTPQQRVELCLRAAGAVGLVSSRQCGSGETGFCVPSWDIEELLSQSQIGFSPAAGKGVQQAVCPTDPAYVIYTSGSTGQPKGIVVTHRSICHFLRSENAVLGIREDDIVYQGFSVAFDMSFEEIWISYLVGATLWLAPASCATDPDAIANAAAANRISVMHAVPTLMGLIEDPLPTVRLINLGGEACPDPLVARLARPGRRLVNTYGPTEATVSASLAELTPGRPVTIGRPLPNYGIVLLDSDGCPMPNGDAGEIGLFGPGVAVGYLGQPELTAEKFIDNPLAQSCDEARLYRTGDMGKIDASSEVVYLGRADGQVKIRGFRVELGEIESAIAAVPGVAAAAVTMRPIAGIEQLVAFVIPSQAGGTEPAELRKPLAEQLPNYMVPTQFVLVEELPRLTSGKIDRKALGNVAVGKKGTLPFLPIDDPQAGTPAARQLSARPPAARDGRENGKRRSAEECDLYAALSDFFPGQGLQGDLDFFDDLGGHSLLVARLVSRLRGNRRYASLSIQDIYRERQLGRIAGRMQQVARLAAAPAKPGQAADLPTSAGHLALAMRRLLCGLAQAVVIPMLMMLNIGVWLFPFFVYHYFTGDEGDSLLLAAAYSVLAFLLAELAQFPVAIAGKWIVAGRLKPGCYPLWGWTYFRWWLADRLCNLPRLDLLSGTPLLNGFLRALGARIGKDAVIDSMYVRAADLLTIGSGASIGTAVHIGNARVERGMLILGPVSVGHEAVVDSYAVLQNDTSVGEGARLGGLSSLAAGRCIPPGENWEGSPAARVDRPLEPLPPRPRAGRMARVSRVAFFVLAAMAVAALFFMTVFPGFMLIDWIDLNDVTHPLLAFAYYFFLSIPAGLVLISATTLLAGGLRRLFLPRLKAGVYSQYGLDFCRNWVLNRVLDSSLGVLHGVYASSFAPAWLRLMGAKVGRHTEVSTAVGIVPELLMLGDDAFIADGVMLGDVEQRGGWMVLRPTIIGDRSFVGNGAYVASGAEVPGDVLIGVQTRTPENAEMRSGQTWMGSPPILLPAREPIGDFDDSLTFRPHWTRKLARAAIEALRIVLPLAFIIAAGYLIVQLVMPLAEDEAWFAMAGALALSGVLFGLGSFLVVVALKWALLGRYRPRAAPMWTLFVWLSEAVTNVYESLAVPNLLEHLRGTPLLPWALRMLGTKIGRGVYLDTTDLTEFDCVSIGDEAELNGWCGPQTHLFEDRVMKIGRVEIGAAASIGESSTVLYDSHIGARVVLGPMTLIAKGERLPPDTAWAGSPATSSA